MQNPLNAILSSKQSNKFFTPSDWNQTLRLYGLCYLVFLVGICVTSKAENSGFLTYDIVNQQAVITGCDRDADQILIPPILSGFPVTEISDHAFFKCDNLTTLEMPDSVIQIGYRAFFLCSALTDIAVPGSVTHLGIEAFSHCYSLLSVTLPDSLKTIEYRVFYKCSSLLSVSFPQSVTQIKDEAFYGCFLKEISLPQNLIGIGSRAFAANALKNILIPDKVRSIGPSAFAENRFLTSVTLGRWLADRDSLSSFGVFSEMTHVHYLSSVVHLTMDSVLIAEDEGQRQVPQISLKGFPQSKISIQVTKNMNHTWEDWIELTLDQDGMARIVDDRGNQGTFYRAILLESLD